MPTTHIRLGTRGSALALAQSEIVKAKFLAKFPEMTIQICPIKTQGDADQKSPLSQIGGKGIFIKEIEKALCHNEIDIAVHSLKDVTTHLEEELALSGFLKAESTSDVLIGTLPPNAVVATSSLRRRALLKKERPDITFVDIRGNVETRIQKLKTDQIDAIVLSEAGLIRLNLTHHISQIFDPKIFYPAPGQGVIALETRQADTTFSQLCNAISDPEQTQISKAEFTVLQALGFDCRIPLGVYSTAQAMTLFIANKTLDKTFVKTVQMQNLQEAIDACKIFLSEA